MFFDERNAFTTLFLTWQYLTLSASFPVFFTFLRVMFSEIVLLSHGNVFRFDRILVGMHFFIVSRNSCVHKDHNWSTVPERIVSQSVSFALLKSAFPYSQTGLLG